MYGNTRILQENTVFVDSLTSSTTVIISDSCSLAFSLGVGGKLTNFVHMKNCIVIM